MEAPAKTLSSVAIISAAFNICQSWVGIGATFALSVGHGGNATVIYGLILIFIVYGAIALSTAELVAQYPTAGGQYHWSAILAPPRIRREVSYICGCINTIGWITWTASVLIIPPQIIVGVIEFYSSSYKAQRWHVVIIYQILNVGGAAYNIFALQKAPWTHNIGFVLSITSFLAITITCLVIAEPKQPSAFVWKGFENDTGWSSNGTVFFMGLISINYGFAGLDGAVHLAEDCTNAASAIPLALASAVAIGFSTTFVFTIAALYCVKDYQAVVNSPTQEPLYELWYQATQSRTAATVFILIIAILWLFTLIGVQQTASRLTWSFARDDALIWSDYIKRVDIALKLPVWAMLFNFVWTSMLGCIYLASSTAFNAILGPGLILEQLCFAIPALLLILQRRDPRLLPNPGAFNLGRAGWIPNVITVLWACLELVFYDLPIELPVTAGNMNYTAAVVALTAVFVFANWWFHGKKHYRGPKVDFAQFNSQSNPLSELD